MAEKDPFDLSSGVPSIPKVDGDLRPSPKAADRISKRVLGLAFGVVVLIVVLFLFSLGEMDNKPKPKEKPPKSEAQLAQDAKIKTASGPNPIEAEEAQASKSSGKTEPLSPSLPKYQGDGTSSGLAMGGLLGGRVGDGSKQRPGLPPGDDDRSGARASDVPPLGRNSQIPADDLKTRTVPALTPEQLEAEKARQDRASRLSQARLGGLSSKPFTSGSEVASSVSAPGAKPQSQGIDVGLFNNAGPGVQKLDGEQESKQEFLKTMGKEANGYHPYVPRAAVAPQSEIKTGSFIPMTLETSINSDLPGQIIARVTEDVYDSITGCRMLIPAMAKVVGRYDSKVALGQGRMLVAWNSLIFPNGDELNLAGMQGYDTSGQAGLESDVDNHYWRMFGLTFGLSMITTGVQLSVPQPNPTTSGAAAPQTTGQIIAASLAQQYGALGAQILGKYMAVQPTLRNFAGERFVVMVPRTIIFPKIWRDRCGAGR